MSGQEYFQIKITKGMTLIELLVTMLLAILMITVGTPGFVTLRQSQAQTSAVNEMYGLLQFSRSLAITDATTVSLCASTSLDDCSGGQNLALGSVVMAMNNAGESTLVRVIDPIDIDGASVTLIDFPSDSSIDFSDTGEILNMTTAASVVFCDPRGSEDGEALIVNPLGMIRQATDDDGDGVKNLHDQTNLSC